MLTTQPIKVSRIPPTKSQPNTKPANAPAPNLQRAVIYQVAPNATNPTSCSVLINDYFPPKSGYSLPSGTGQFYMPGSTVVSNTGATVPTPGPFFCSPTAWSGGPANTGGSWCLVNTDTMSVVQIMQGISTFAPSGPNLVASHVHTGATDSLGNPMPQPINLQTETSGTISSGQLPAGAPVAPALVPYGGVGGATVVQQDNVAGLFQDYLWTVNVTNVPQNQSVNSLAWAYRLTGSTAWILYAETTMPGLPSPAAAETVSFAYGQLSNGIAYDFALAYVNVGGVIGYITPFATNFSGGPLTILPYLTSTPWTPTVSAVSFTPAPSVDGLTATVAFSFLVTNQPTDGSLARINLYFRPTGQTTWTPAFSLPSTLGSRATYTGQVADLTVGSLYDFGMTGEDVSGTYETAVVTLATSVNVGSISIPNVYMLGNVAAAAPTFSGTPTCTPSASVNGLASNVSVALTTANQPVDGSLSRLNFWYRSTTITSPSTSAGWSCAGGVPSGGIGLAGPAASYNYQFSYNDLTNGIHYWFGVSYEDNQGDETEITTIPGSPITAQTIGIPSTYLLSSVWTPTVASVSFTPAPSVNGLTATLAFSFQITNQVADGSLGRINLWFKPHSATTYTPAFGLAPLLGTTGYPTYTGQISNLTVGTLYDFGMTAQSVSGNYETALVTLATSVNVGSVSIPAPYMLGGASPLTPVVASLSIGAAASPNGIAAYCAMTFSITNQPTNGSLSRVNFWYRQTSLANGVNTIGQAYFHWQPSGGVPAYGVGSTPAPSTGNYYFTIDVTPGIAYDYAVSMEDNQGDESILGIITTNYTATILGIPNQYLTQNVTYTPSVTAGIAASPLSPPPTGIGNYPALTPAIKTATSNNGLTAAWTISFSVNNQPTDGSLSRVSLWYSSVGGAPWSFYASVPAYGVGEAPPPAVGYYSTTLEDLGNGIEWSFGVSCEDMTGNETVVVAIASASTPVPVQPGGLEQGQNAVVDSGWLASTYSSRMSASNPYWYFYNIANPYQDLWQNDGARGNSLQVRSEASGVDLSGVSQPIPVVAGQAYTISFLCDARGCSGGSTGGAYIGIVNTTGTNTYSTVYAAAHCVAGSLARVSATWTCPTTGGPSEVSVAVNSDSMHVPAGYTLFMYEPMFQEGSLMTGYVPGPANPGVVDHTTMSAQTQAVVSYAVGSDGSYLASEVVSARTLVGTVSTNVTSSQVIRAQQSALAVASNFTAYMQGQSSATSYGNYGTSPAATYGVIYFGWLAWQCQYPDGYTLSFGIFPGSFSSSNVIGTGQSNYVSGDGISGPYVALTASTGGTTTYYAAVYQATFGTSALTTVFYTTAASYNQFALLYGDGSQTLAVNVAVTLPTKPGSSSSNGSTVSPPVNTCPAVGQVMMTSRGPVLAEDLRIGDQLLDWKHGTYNRIYNVMRLPATIWEVVVANGRSRERLLVDENHKFATPLGWWPVKWLQRGDEVVNANGSVMYIDKCISRGPGEYIGIDCDRRRFRIGNAIGHNIFTGVHN